jgi:beta-glucanase (GH16 family)
VDESGNLIIADVGLVVVGEQPYAEWEGDTATLALSSADISTIERVRAQSETLIVVLISGRPLIVTDQLNAADAFVAAWLPGTEGAGVTDVLFGDAEFSGRLGFTWPRNIDQIPFDFANLATEGCDAPLFPFNYGLTTAASESAWVALALECDPLVIAEAVELAEVVIPDAPPLAPEGEYGVNYYAPFPLTITLDGNLADWAGVPTVLLESAANTAAVTFGAAADSEYLYFFGNVIDDNIISGQHGGDYWNEDSVEFYVNATGDLELRSYAGGVAQMTIASLPADPASNEAIIAGVRGTTVNARAVTVQTTTGYLVEVAVPLVNDVWEIVPTHEGVIGFQVHLNGATDNNRDTKLIWSIFDTSDQSYQNPSLFGQLIFFAVGEDMAAQVPSESESESAAVGVDNSITWDSRSWELVWADEFDGDAGTPINSEFWSFDIGGHGWGNNELEYHTDRVENVSLDGSGNLAIVAREENPDGLNCHYGTCRYTSARILTRDKVEFTYGRVEARIRIPRGQGIWPAFWMLGANFPEVGWPFSGEIDILENVGHEPRTVHGTIHGPGFSGANGIGGSYNLDADFADDFHVYAIDWDEDAIRWYVDGELFNTITPNDLAGREWVYDHDFFLILNIAVGGNWPGEPDATTEFPQTMLVDYVRVYRLAGE